ncbi:MAG: hypothetical protein RM022_027585, partial [Nostoc sp. EfeVER01]|nr:hypothetical protein [Nostoc sp. EfeVER01]
MNLPATVSRKLQKSAAFILLSLALAGLEIPSSTGQSLPNSSTKSAPLADGTYLYGETPKPNQIGKAYLLLQRQQGNIVGALYYPSKDSGGRVLTKGTLEGEYRKYEPKPASRFRPRKLEPAVEGRTGRDNY